MTFYRCIVNESIFKFPLLIVSNLIFSRETFLMKLGLKEERWGDEQLMEKLLDMMQQTGADFTATFRQLAEVIYS